MSAPNHDATGPRRDAWSSYWAHGTLHSCAGSFDGNYGGAIGAFWDAVVDGLAERARVLDLATGNGALPLRIWQRHPGRDGLRIDAVDLADVAPGWLDPAMHAGIAFHPRVHMERLPFADGAFDLVASQYGIEYGPRPDALDEAMRVLRPAGTLALAMHHAGSVLVRVGRQELVHLDRLLAPDGLVAAAREVLPWLRRARRGEQVGGDPRATAARERYNRASSEVGDAIAGSAAPDVLVESREQVHRLLAGVPPGTDAGTALAALAAALGDARLRTAELVSHALDEQAIAAMAARIRVARPSATVSCEPIAQAEGVLGWGLVARG